MIHRIVRREIAVSVIVAFVASIALAQPATLNPEAAVESQEPGKEPQLQEGQTSPLDQLKSQLERVRADQTGDETVRDKLTELYTLAIAEWESAQASAAKLEELQQEVANFDDRLDEVQSQLEASPEKPTPPDPNADLVQLQAELTRQETSRVQKAQELEASEAELARRAERRIEVPGLLTEARKKLAETEAAINAPRPEDEDPLITEATRSLQQARREALTRQIALLGQEIPTYDTTAKLMTAERDLAARELTQLTKAVSKWQEYVNEQRGNEAVANLTKARQLAAHVNPLIADVATGVVDLAEEVKNSRQELSRRIRATSEERRRTEHQTRELESEFEQLTSRAQTAGFTNDVGRMLREHRRNLPTFFAISAEMEAREQEITKAHLQKLDYQSRKKDAYGVQTLIDETIESLTTELDETTRQQVERDLRSLYSLRETLLEGVIQDQTTYLTELISLESAKSAQQVESRAEAEYIAEHILWVRSTNPVGLADVSAFGDSLQDLLRKVSAAGRAIKQDLTQQPLVYLFATLLFLLLIGFRWRIRRVLRGAGELASKRMTTTIQPTIVAALCSLIVSAIWPAFCAFIGWRLESSAGAASGAGILGSVLQRIAVFWFTLELLRQVFRPLGLAEAHFEWPARSVSVIRRSVRSLVPIAVPLSLLVLIGERSTDDVLRDSIGRIALIAFLMFAAYSMHRVLRPRGPVMEEAIASRSGFGLTWTRYVWYILGVALPILFVVMAVTGYHYTARQLTWRFVQTLWLVVSMLLLDSLLKRWQLMTYRRLAIDQARERREAQSEMEDASADAEAVASILKEMTKKLAESNAQLRHLLQLVFIGVTLAGIWWIWQDVLPAFRVFSRFELWPSAVGTNALGEAEQITVADVLLGLVVALVTLSASRNLPGFLEFTLLRRLPLDAGSRYAISSVSRYAIVVLGAVLMFRIIGIGWTSVQWLVAAISVGLGFGLQEIFANFVSGLILFAERPIRVGDTVTVGDITGTVTRIRIRATTIIDWDRKELVVPNREFVTGQLVNWTLSDAVLRVVIRVGIAYGSDTRLATRLLLKVAEDNPNVLADPAPNVIFWAFGESSLDYELRVFVQTIQQFRIIPHELNLAIDDAFREANIEIAFPQRDLHVRSFDQVVPIASTSTNGKIAGPTAASAINGNEAERETESSVTQN